MMNLLFAKIGGSILGWVSRLSVSVPSLGRVPKCTKVCTHRVPKCAHISVSSFKVAERHVKYTADA